VAWIWDDLMTDAWNFSFGKRFYGSREIRETAACIGIAFVVEYQQAFIRTLWLLT
jgi:hypothetical protein